MHRRLSRFRLVLTSVALLQLTCSGDTPTAPRRGAAPSEAPRAASASDRGAALNNPPRPALPTTPPADTSGPFPTITGVAPLTVVQPLPERGPTRATA